MDDEKKPYCGLGSCTALAGHDGSCAEASGWETGETMTDDEKRVAEIRKRAEAATEGPWNAGDYTDLPDDEGCGITAGPEGTIEERIIAYAIEYPWTTPESCTADAEFIAHAREDIPWLLADRTALLERLRTTEAERGDREFLRRVWKAMGCEQNPDDFKASVRDQMWQMVVEDAAANAAKNNWLYRENVTLMEHLRVAEVRAAEAEAAVQDALNAVSEADEAVSAEIARRAALEAVITEAPHDPDCTHRWDDPKGLQRCECYKSAATSEVLARVKAEAAATALDEAADHIRHKQHAESVRLDLAHRAAAYRAGAER